MTDAEVTSLVATELAKYDESPVTEPQIWFTKGKIYGTGRLVNVMPIETEFYVVASARILDGQVVVEIEEISAGALPIPHVCWIPSPRASTRRSTKLQLDVEVTALEILEGEAHRQGHAQVATRRRARHDLGGVLSEVVWIWALATPWDRARA